MERYAATRKVALLGLLGNVLLAVVKTIVGILARSQALIADGLNSAGDVFASFLTWMGNRIASVPRDKDHPFGHGKAEYVFSMIIGLSMIVAAVTMAMSAVGALRAGAVPEISAWVYAAIAFTLAMKTALLVVTLRAGKKHESLLLRANAEDHRNDLFVTTGTLIGTVGAALGVRWLDGVVGLLISVWLGIAGGRIALAAYRVLMDTAAAQGLIDEIRRMVLGVPGVDHLDDVLATPVGVRYLLIVKISVEKTLTVQDAHGISGHVRAELLKRGDVMDVVVHVNPA